MSEGATSIETDPLIGEPPSDKVNSTRIQSPSRNWCKFSGAVLSTLKCSFGAGILGFPYAFRRAGWLGGMLSCLVVSITTGFGMHMCVQIGLGMRKVAAKHEVYSKRKYLEYTDLAQLSIGTWARRCAFLAILLGQIGVGIAYTIFMANNLTGSFFSVSTPRWLIVLSFYPVVLGLTFVQDLKDLLWAAKLGLVFMVVGIIFLLNYGFKNPTFPNNLPVVSLDGMVLAIGISTFAMESITVIPSLMASMREPKEFPSVLNIAIVSVLVLYSTFGVVGAICFGISTKSVITRDIPVGTVSGVGSRLALVCYIL